MFILTRRLGETIVIGGKVRVMVLNAGGSKVSLGITAPESVRVDRMEVHQLRSFTGLASTPRTDQPTGRLSPVAGN